MTHLRILEHSIQGNFTSFHTEMDSTSREEYLIRNFSPSSKRKHQSNFTTSHLVLKNSIRNHYNLQSPATIYCPHPAPHHQLPHQPCLSSQYQEAVLLLYRNNVAYSSAAFSRSMPIVKYTAFRLSSTISNRLAKRLAWGFMEDFMRSAGQMLKLSLCEEGFWCLWSLPQKCKFFSTKNPA